MANTTITTAGSVSLKTLLGNDEFVDRGYTSISVSSDADVTASAAQYKNLTMKLSGTAWTTARNFVVPTIAGAVCAVINTTGQGCTVKTAAGSGVLIASTKAAIVVCDGTNIVRVTADA